MKNLAEISKPIFLHFLSRGLQESVNSYYETPYEKVKDDFRFMLASSYENAYISTAHLFENELAFKLISDFPKLFWFGHILVSQKETSIGELVAEKKSQYRHVKEKYPHYYNDRWKIIVDKGPTLKLTEGVSRFLHEDLLSALQEETKKKSNEIQNPFILNPYLIEGINERKNKALTNDLFLPIYDRFGINNYWIGKMDRFINEYYLRVQIRRENGTIITGVSSGVDYYSFLCPTFPFHHLPIWKEIFHILGLRRLIRELDDNEFYQLRESSIFIQFIDIIRILIEKNVGNEDNHILTLVKFIQYTNPKKQIKSFRLEKFIEVIENFIFRVKKEILSDFSENMDFVILQKNSAYQINLAREKFESNELRKEAQEDKLSIKHRLLDQLSKAELGPVLLEVISFTKAFGLRGLNEEAIIISSKFNRVEKENMLGILDNDTYGREIAKISKAILFVINNLDR